MAPRLVITRRLPPAVEARAAKAFTLSLNGAGEPWDVQSIISECRGADALMPCVADRIDHALIDALPETVRIIANFGAGTDHIDLKAAKSHCILVTNTPGVLTAATADITLLLILGATRRAKEGIEQIERGTWPGWSPTHLLGAGLQGKKLGILGMGRIGQAVAARAHAFGLEVHYYSRTRLPPEHEGTCQFHANLDGLLAVSEILSLHCAATPETRGIIDATSIEKLPTGAVLINTARGDVVNDDAIIAALRNGQLSAVGLDVFNNEPQIDARYHGLANALLLPHLGSATVETRTAMGMLALDNLDAHFQGVVPPNLVK